MTYVDDFDDESDAAMMHTIITTMYRFSSQYLLFCLFNVRSRCLLDREDVDLISLSLSLSLSLNLTQLLALFFFVKPFF